MDFSFFIDVIGCDGKVENSQAVTLPGFEKPVHPGSSGFGKFKKKFSLVAPMGNVPCISRQRVTFRSGHDVY